MTISRNARIVLFAGAFEAGLGLLGIGAAAVAGLSIAEMVRTTAPAREAFIGILASVPAAAVFFLALRSKRPGLARIRRILNRHIVPYARELSLWQLALLSLIAGLGEELLFRGFLQSLLTGAVGLPAAVLLTAVAFGLVHRITTLYAVYAGVLGAYLGVLAAATGGLLATVVCHGVYDFIALGVYVRRAA
ncbi:MAG: CPBP family intramembrane glutamic endopeptidase, partial [Spirochaetaceae bacterium]